MPPIDLSVPADVPEQITLTDKEGKVSFASGPAMYTATFRQGWLECWDRHSKGEQGVLTKDSEPALVQEYGIEARGRLDGFNGCKAALIARNRP